jgi:hypothetical protein
LFWLHKLVYFIVTLFFFFFFFSRFSFYGFTGLTLFSPRLLLLLYVLLGVSSAQTFNFCLDLCSMANVQPAIDITCASNGRNLNVSSVVWGCNNAQAVSGTTDQSCGDPAIGTQASKWPGNTGPSPCTWQVNNQQVDDTSQFIVIWNSATGLANLGTSPTFSFQAVLSNPPPSQVEVSLTSITGGLATRCIIGIPLTNTGQQPQAFTATFSAGMCPAGFNPNAVSRLIMTVSGPSISGPSTSFTLVQGQAPFQGPCFAVSPCPQAGFTVVKATNTVSVNAPGPIPYTFTINNNGQVICVFSLFFFVLILPFLFVSGAVDQLGLD